MEIYHQTWILPRNIPEFGSTWNIPLYFRTYFFIYFFLKYDQTHKENTFELNIAMVKGKSLDLQRLSQSDKKRSLFTSCHFFTCQRIFGKKSDNIYNLESQHLPSDWTMNGEQRNVSRSLEFLLGLIFASPRKKSAHKKYHDFLHPYLWGKHFNT